MTTKTRKGHRLFRNVALAASALLVCCQFAPSQEPPGESAEPATPEATSTDDLAFQQSQLADKFNRLETLMLRTSEFDAPSNPRRSALLRQALKQSKDKFMRLQMESLVRLLNQNKLSPAVDKQQHVLQDLKLLLQLLLTENRPDRLKNEQQRVRNYIKELERIIRQQRAVQGRTEGGDDTKRLAQDQGRVADRTDQLGQSIDENEGGGNAHGHGDEADGSREDAKEDQAGKPTDQGNDNQQQAKGSDRDGQRDEQGQGKRQGERTPGEQGEGQQGEGQQGEGQQGEGQQGEGQQGEGQQGEGQQGQAQPGQGQQGQAQPGEGQQPQQEQAYPGRKRIAAAEEKMREARQRLDEARRNEAVEEQEQARQLLEQAKAELEEILRQLREEEIERMLALLEVRFRKMLEMQLRVYESTKRLDKTPSEIRDRQIDLQAGKLGLQERRIVVEADKTLALLHEEGSSVAFPEAVEQMREDMQQVVDRLGRTKIGALTQGIEQDIITALEEMIEALQQAQQDQEQRRQNQRPPPPGEPQDSPLVDALAEIKLIKALQVRVNTRTNRYAGLLDDIDDPAGQAMDEDLIEALRRLSDREERIVRITRDIVLGRNK